MVKQQADAVAAAEAVAREEVLKLRQEVAVGLVQPPSATTRFAVSSLAWVCFIL